MSTPGQQVSDTRRRKRTPSAAGAGAPAQARKNATDEGASCAAPGASESAVDALLTRLEDTAWLTAQAISVGRRMSGGRREPQTAARPPGSTRARRSSRPRARARAQVQVVVLDPAARALLDAMPVAVLWLNQHGAVQHCNAAALQRLGTPLLGESWRRVAAERISVLGIRDPLPADAARATTMVSSNAYLNGQLVVLTDAHTGTPPEPGAPSHEQQSRDRQLVRLGRLCAGLAHQLRTPIAAAQLYLDLASASGDRVYLARAQSALDALARHSESVLTLARGELLCEPDVSLNTLLTLVQRQAQALRGRLHMDMPAALPAVRCNLHLLAGALLNLVDNAMRASKSAEAQLSVLSTNGAVQFQVSDDGDGFPTHLLPLLGQPMPSSRTDGAGLGLEMANMIVEAHGGSLTIESSAAGTHVRVSLPRTSARPRLPARS